jgi:hypothetical protein
MRAYRGSGETDLATDGREREEGCAVRRGAGMEG